MAQVTEQATRIERRIFFLSLFIAVLITATAIFMKSDYPETQHSFEHMYAAHEVAGGLLSAAILMAYFLRRKSNPLLTTLETLPGKITGNSFPLMVFVTVVLAVCAITIYHARPLNVDEYSVYFQAQIFAEGKIAGHYPPPLLPWLVPASHLNTFFAVSSQTGSIVAAYWPGFSLLLAPFMKLGVPWLLNPLLTLGTLYLLWLLSRRLFRAPEAPGWVLLFTIASPVIIVNALSYYTMTAHLFMNLLYAWLLLEMRPLRIFLAGLVGSVALELHNPFPHMLFALPWIIWIARKPARGRNLSLLFLGYLPLTVLLGFGWVWLKMKIVKGTVAAVQTTVKNSKMVSTAFAAKAVDEGIVWKLLREPFKLLRQRHIFTSLPHLDFLWLRFLGILKIFAWAVPALPILAFMGGKRLQKQEVVLRLWCWSALLTLIGYVFVPATQGHGWGFRYFHSVWAALPLLATFLVLQPQVLSNAGRNFILVMALLSFFFGNGVRMLQAYSFIGDHLAQLPQIEEETGGKVQLVFVDAVSGFYAQDLVQNDPFLRGQTIYLLSRGNSLDRKLLQTYFPDAEKVRQTGLDSVWLVNKERWQNLTKS